MRLRPLVPASFLALFLSIPAARADNPIIQTKHTADPAPRVYNDTVYLYASHDEDNASGFTMGKLQRIEQLGGARGQQRSGRGLGRGQQSGGDFRGGERRFIGLLVRAGTLASRQRRSPGPLPHLGALPLASKTIGPPKREKIAQR